MKKPSIKVLPNGLTVVCVKTESPSVTVTALVSTGSRYEDQAMNGISHFLEHLCFKGTTTKTGKEIMRYLDGLGAETNAFTSQELTGYYVKSITRYWKKTLAVVADIYLNSTFPELEMEKEKGVIVGEINMYEDMPTSKVQDIITTAVFGDQPLGWSILGPKENIKKMSRNEIINYHHQQYTASATTIIIAGDIDKQEVHEEVAKHFKAIRQEDKNKAKKHVPNSTPSKVLVHQRSTDQTHVVMAYEGLGYKDTDARTLSVIAALLGGGMSSRLFEKLREDMGAGYYVHAYSGSFSDTGIFEIGFGIEGKRLEEVVDAVLSEVSKLAQEEIDSQELKKTQEYMIGNYLMGLESTDALGYFYGKRVALGLPLMTPKEIAREIKKVNSRDIKRVAKKILATKKLKIALVGPHTHYDEKKLTILSKKYY